MTEGFRTHVRRTGAGLFTVMLLEEVFPKREPSRDIMKIEDITGGYYEFVE